MKIEKGKFYKTRGGLKVEIYKTDVTGGAGTIHGAILSKDGSSNVDSWTDDGTNFFGDDDELLDIVSEWEEPSPKPKLRAFINMYDGTVRMFNSDAKLDFIRAPWLDEPEEN